MPTSKLNSYLSTFLLFLILVGYPLVTTLLLPNYTDYARDVAEADTTITRQVTVPFRAFVLVISLTLIVLHWKRRVSKPLAVCLYFVFWFLLSFRIIYDLLIRTDIIVDPSVVQNQFLYAYLVCLLPAIAVYRSHKSIDYGMAFKWIVGGYILLAFALAYSNPLIFSTERVGFRLSGNIALDTIQLGFSGAVMSLLGICWFGRSYKIWQKVIAVLMMLAGIVVLLRAGSRGPLVAFVGSLVFYLVARQKSPIKAVSLLAVILTLLFFASELFFNSIQQISPLMAGRMTLSGNVTQYEELSSHRDVLYDEAIDKFLNHPVFGDSYALFHANGSMIYSHNMVLDAFMGLGLFGGILFIIMLGFALWHSYQMIHRHDPHCWLGVLGVCYIIRHMFSFSFYQADDLNALLITLFMYV